MELSPAMWTCLLGACLVSVLPALTLTTSLVLPRPPRLVNCVFQQRANITCRWESGDPQPFTTTHYILQIEKMRSAMPWGKNSSLIVIETFNCTTSDTSCTVDINNSNVAFTFCIAITAHSPSGLTKSARRCQSGRKEVMLAPVNLHRVEPVSGRPRCLMVTWDRPMSYAVSETEIKGGNLTSQIEYSPQGQPSAQVKDVKVTDSSFVVCRFRPDTLYTIRLRHHFNTKASPWSQWSNRCHGRTGEDTPSAAPAFWRQVKETDRKGWRLVALLWKPLPHFLANGRVLSYNVTCKRKSARVLNDHESCGVLHHTRTSCSLLLPPGRCSCLLTASNSVGTSPEAQIWLLGVSETEPPPLDQITANPLDDNSLNVRWTAPVDKSVSGFVVEWHAVTEEKSSILHWDRLNSTCKVITEGVEPMVRYAVSVKAVYGDRGTGQSRILHVYTSQGVPSTGPKVEVQEISGNRVELSWNPIPVEQQRGYIRNYTLHYTLTNEPTRRECVPGQVYHYSLRNLSPGNYDIYIQANTDAGTGVAGPISNVNIGPEDISLVTVVVKCASLPFILILLGLVLTAILVQNKTVKQKLCQDIPDPSHSSLAHWTPKALLENMKWLPMAEKPKIHYSEITLVGGSGLQDSGPVQDVGYHTVCSLHTYPSHLYTSFSPTGVQTPHNARGCEKEHTQGPPTPPTRSITTSTAEHNSLAATLPSCHCICSHVLFSQPNPQYHLQLTDSQITPASFHDNKLQLGGESELPVHLQDAGSALSLSQTNRLEISHLPPAEKNGLILPSVPQSLSPSHRHNPLSFSILSSVSDSFNLSQAVEVSSPHHSFSPSFQLNPFSFSFPHPVLDLSSFSLLPSDYSVDCDPYISSDM